MKRSSLKIFLFISILSGVLFAPMTSFAAPGDPAPAAAPAATAPPLSETFGLQCGVFGDSQVSHCVPLLAYWIVYTPATWILALGGSIFDALTAFSLSSTVINDPFVQTGWTMVRDIANAVFIFLLLYLGIKTVLGLGDWKKPVGMIIVVALLMNFSLFFTKVVIDVSNLAAYQFYNAIGGGSEAVRVNQAALGFQAHSISTRLVNTVSPQQLVGIDSWQAWEAKGGSIFDLFFI